MLGDPDTQPVNPAIFTNSDVHLRIWFNDGTNGFALLSPDQRLTSAPFAMTAATLPNGVVTSNSLAAGAVTSAKLAPAAITTSAIANGAITAAGLAPNSVTASAIADGTISQSKLNFQLGFINGQNPPFGAVGNGTNDDTAAIQAALNSAGNNGGGIVFLPRGNYRINSSLVIPAQTSLVGVWRAPTAFSQNL